MNLTRKMAGFLLVTMMVVGVAMVAGVASATIFTATQTYGSGTTGQLIAANGTPFEISVATSGFSVPSDTINSAVLSIGGYNAFSQPGQVKVGDVSTTDLLLGTLQGGHNTSATTTFTNGSLLTFLQAGWSLDGPLGIDITAGDKNFWLDNYTLTVDYTDPPPAVPEPAARTMMLFGAGFFALVTYIKRRA